MAKRKSDVQPSGVTPLDSVMATIVEIMGSVDLYHYNKLAYLFEYLYIKNFGARYTGEKFVKLPHGPVIKSYPKQIKELAKKDVVDAPIDKLTERRPVDEKFYPGVYISKNENTGKYSVQAHIVRQLIEKVVATYGNMQHSELEEIVYNTPPVVSYLAQVGTRFGPQEIGSYVLESRCIKITDYKNPIAEARQLIANLEAMQAGPNEEQEKIYEEEFSWLNQLKV